MPRFTQLDPQDVVIGRTRFAQEKLKPYLEALGGSEAGRIDLEDSEKSASARHYLAMAAKQLGLTVRASFIEDENALEWKTAAPSAQEPKSKAVRKPRAAKNAAAV
jgi:hypothetical protein